MLVTDKLGFGDFEVPEIDRLTVPPRMLLLTTPTQWLVAGVQLFGMSPGCSWRGENWHVLGFWFAPLEVVFAAQEKSCLSLGI